MKRNFESTVSTILGDLSRYEEPPLMQELKSGDQFALREAFAQDMDAIELKQEYDEWLVRKEDVDSDIEAISYHTLIAFGSALELIILRQQFLQSNRLDLWIDPLLHSIWEDDVAARQENRASFWSAAGDMA